MSRHRPFKRQLKKNPNREYFESVVVKTNRKDITPSREFGNISFNEEMLTYETLSGEFEHINDNIDTLNFGVSGLVSDFCTLSTDVSTLSDELSGKVGFEDLIIEKPWSDLKLMRDAGTLIPGQQYRIMDYVATVANDANARSANHPFDLIVVADSESKLNEKARAIRHSGDTYFPASVKFEAWQVWYCLDNDTNRFAWADTTNGKGVVYRLIDEWSNDCPYDFKGIQFKAYGDTDNVWRYTFDSGSESGNTDYSLDGGVVTGNFVYGNVIRTLSEADVGQRLNIIVFKGAGCYSNTFGNSCASNTFGESCSSNTFGNSCASNTFGNSCASNTFGESCSSNTFGNSCSSIVFGDDPAQPRSYFRFITFEPGVFAVLFDCPTISDIDYCQNITVAKGVNSVTIEVTDINQAYKTTYEPYGSQTIDVSIL